MKSISTKAAAIIALMLLQTTIIMAQKMFLTIGDRSEAVTLVDNQATQELVARLEQAPVTVTLDSSGGFEIWGPLGFSLTTSNEYINAQAGDVILYSGSNICIFYGSNSWSYTRLGRIDGLTDSELRSFLKAGESNISVTLSLDNPTRISQVKAEESKAKAYTTLGIRTSGTTKGVIIKNKSKYIK